MSDSPDNPDFRAADWRAPRHWPVWLALGLMWLLAKLPFDAQLWLGRRIGDLLRLAAPKRQRVVRANLRLAFPDKTDAEREALLVENYRHTGMSLLEMGALWFVPREQLWARMRIEGHEHLDAARASENGVILLQAHFTTLELCGNLLGAEIGMDANYDDPNNALYAAWLRAQRERFLDETIHNRNIRRMVRRLKSGHTVWFSPDQWVRGSRGGLLTQYFGRDVFTSPGTARIAAMTGAQVVPFLPVREANGRYCLKLFPALIDFPSGDLAADTQRINALFESQIRAYPAQYLWLHKRFKRVGPEQPDLYA